ncbi:hypothetical protein ACNYS0_21005 [Streptomyces sp. BH034]|uniref:hypothetical protein n=1 Tax=Streptomyces sp. BH034 TaxID=3402626 RepID=UPI003BB4E6AD
MESIRNYQGEVRLCASCGQPCYLGPTAEFGELWQHFREQWDGIHCDRFPLPPETIEIAWSPMSLQDLKRTYPDAHRKGQPVASA